MSNQHGYWLAPLVVGALLALSASTATAQIFVPPNNGFNATIALPSTIEAFWTGVNQGLEETGDGLNHIFGPSGKTEGEGEGSLKSLQPGKAVAVQYVVKGIQASADPNLAKANEGTVVGVERGRKQVTIKFADGTANTFESDNSFTSHSSRAIVYYSDETGRRVAHLFKPRP